MNFQEKKKKIEELIKNFRKELAKIRKKKIELFKKLEKERAQEEIEAIKKEIEEKF